MRTEKLIIGSNIGTEKVKVECKVREPDTLQEALELARTEEELLGMFVRGWRIRNQEDSGARDFVAASTVEQRKAPDFAAKVQAIVDAYNPTERGQRGRPSKPKEVQVQESVWKTMPKASRDAMAEQLKAQGVTLNITKQ